MVDREIQRTKSNICKKWADSFNLNIINIAALDPAED